MTELEMIDRAMEEHEIIGVYSLFSGGHDSLTVTHLTSHHSAFSGVIHIDTGTGLPETKKFVRETCREHEWPLIIHRPHMPYESFIVKRGFPGPAGHGWMYDRLKDRALRIATRDIRLAADAARKSKVMLISGVRKQESDRRAAIQDDMHEEGIRLWMPLIAQWTATDCSNYMKDNGLKRSPVKDTLHMSGECFCGAYKKPHEFNEVEYWYPDQAERIRKWEELVQCAYKNQLWEQECGLREEMTIEEWTTQWGTSRDYSNEQQPLFPMCQLCREE